MELASIKPIAGYVLVEPKEKDSKTEAGIYLPENAAVDAPQSGTVLKVGPDDYNEYGISRKSPVSEGDKVLFKKWGGNEVEIEKKKYLFVKFDDFLAIC